MHKHTSRVQPSKLFVNLETDSGFAWQGSCGQNTWPTFLYMTALRNSQKKFEIRENWVSSTIACLLQMMHSTHCY